MRTPAYWQRARASSRSAWLWQRFAGSFLSTRFVCLARGFTMAPEEFTRPDSSRLLRRETHCFGADIPAARKEAAGLGICTWPHSPWKTAMPMYTTEPRWAVFGPSAGTFRSKAKGARSGCFPFVFWSFPGKMPLAWC